MVKANDAFLINEWLVGKKQMSGKDLKRVFTSLIKDIKPSDLEAKQWSYSRYYSGSDDIKNALLTLATRYSKGGSCLNIVKVNGEKAGNPLYAEPTPSYKLDLGIYAMPYNPESFQPLDHRWFRVRNSENRFKVVEYDTVGVVTGSGTAYTWREFMEKCELAGNDSWWSIVKSKVKQILKLIGV